MTELETLRAENAELRMLMGWIEQAHTITYAKKLIAEFRKAPDFPVCPPSAVLQSPAGGEAGGEK